MIVLQTMMWPDEVRKPDFSVETGEVKAAEVKMANMLVETLAGDFDAGEFEDDYAEAVEALVKAKIEGGEVKRTPTLDQVLRRGRRPARRAAALRRRGQDGARRDGRSRVGVEAEAGDEQAGQEDRGEEDRREEGRRAKKTAAKKTTAKKTAAQEGQLAVLTASSSPYHLLAPPTSSQVPRQNSPPGERPAGGGYEHWGT